MGLALCGSGGSREFTPWRRSHKVASCDISAIMIPAGSENLTLATNPVTIRKNQTSKLTATCDPAATSWVWTGGTCPGTNAATCTVKPAVTMPYTVVGSNTSGAGASASATVAVKTFDITPILMLLLD